MKPLLLAVLGMLLGAAALAAHHALASEYDPDKRLTVKGTLAEIDWRNPHPVFWVDVKDPNGQVIRWRIGSATPNMLVRFPGGWTRDKVFAKLKDDIAVTGWQARDGSNHAYADFFTFSDGTKMQGGIGLGGR
jgi:hypothetical protein